VTAPVQYGARLAAVVVYLLHYQLDFPQFTQPDTESPRIDLAR